MHPLLFDSIPLYFVMWLCAAGVGIGAGTGVAARAGFPPAPSAIALALLALSILGGSKLLYLAEARFFPFDDYVPEQVRGALHGFRIPGGILALAAAMPVVCRVLRLPWRRFGDVMIPLAALALVFIRLGCFLNGCCFGKVSGLPWAVTFPRGSWVFWYHRTQRWIPETAQASLPVHPLQLYFVGAAVLILLILVRHRGRDAAPGHTQLLFYALFFASTAALELLRQNRLTLNSWLVPVAAAVAAGTLVGRTLASQEPGNQRGAPKVRGEASGGRRSLRAGVSS